MGSEHSRASLKSKLGSEAGGEREGNFDEGRIIEHYRRLKERQHHTLSTLNLSEELKRSLFGFSEGYYLTNEVDPASCVILNHPMQGRILMSRHRYNHQQFVEHRKREVNRHEDPDHSVSRLFSGEAGLSSDLEREFAMGMGREEDDNQGSQSGLVTGGVEAI